MTSSVQSVINPDGSPAGVFDRGAGSIRADRALSPTLTVSETAADFAASAGDPLTRLDLNIPSINVDPLPGAAVVKRTVTNVSSRSQTFTAKGTVAGGVRATVVPAVFALAPGASKTVTVIIDGLDAADGWHEGQITIKASRSGTIPVVLPVAVDVGDAQIALAQSCEPTEIKRNTSTTCTVTASSTLPVEVSAKIDVVANPLLKVGTVTAPATKRPLGATWSGTLAAAKPPTIDAVEEVAPETTPGGGFLPLSLFGIAPIAGVGDETIVNFDVAPYVYGGEVYTRIGDRLERLRRRRRGNPGRRRVRAAGDPARQRGTEQRARAVLDRPQPRRRRIAERRHPHRRHGQLGRARVEGRAVVERGGHQLVPDLDPAGHHGRRLVHLRR